MSEDGCIFCAIGQGTAPATIEYQSETVLAFRDVNPQAPVHLLIIPKTHIAGINGATAEHVGVLGEMLLAAKEVAGKLNLTDGYRLVINQGLHGGQLVDHLHMHLLGGRELGRQMVNVDNSDAGDVASTM